MFEQSYMRGVAALVGVASIVALFAYTRLAFTEANRIDAEPMKIVVSGEGEAVAKADIAIFTFSVLASDAKAGTAQTKSATAINAIQEYLKKNAIEERDVKTVSYYLNPQYEQIDYRCTEFGCPPVRPAKIVGYEVSQTIEVRVRKIDTLGELISGVGDLGATNISGPTFTIDDDTALKAEAREKAIADARVQAEKLAKDLGVTLVRMREFSEDTMMPYGGYGGAVMMSADRSMEAKVAPEISVGENTVTSRVSVTYEVR